MLLDLVVIMAFIALGWFVLALAMQGAVMLGAAVLALIEWIADRGTNGA